MIRPEYQKLLDEYIALLACKMDLDDWRFTVIVRSLDRDAAAHVSPVYGQRMATIEIDPVVFECTPAKQRQYIVHELVHCHLEPTASFVSNSLAKTLGQTAYDVFWEGFKQNVEYAVDALTLVLADHMPEPVGLSAIADSFEPLIGPIGGPNGNSQAESGRAPESQEGAIEASQRLQAS